MARGPTRAGSPRRPRQRQRSGCLQYSALPPLVAAEPLVGAVDAGVSDDSFGIVFVGAYGGGIAERAILHYEPPEGGAIDFDQVEQDIRDFCKAHNVIQLTYDSYQLHQMMTRLLNQGVVWTDPFSQGSDRLEADKALLDAVMGRTIAHDGDSRLRTHMDNANRKLDGGRLRIVKRTQRGKIDLAVALSMAHHRAITMFAL
jgi:phage terminase large subunit-like protein